MSKIAKAFKSPDLFFRDYFLKRAPLSAQADINRKTKHDSSIRRTDSGNLKPQTFFSGFVAFKYKVDVVVTWVDGDDIEFQKLRDKFKNHDTSGKIAANNHSRYKSRDELKYCLRSIKKFAPWVNKIFVVTNGQIPTWFNPNQAHVRIVRHDEIIDEEYLPTFNSHVIESCLHRIPDLSERYIYFNDDVMLLKQTFPTDYFTEHGLVRGFLSSAIIPNAPIISSDTPSMVAIKNSRKLLFQATGHYFDAKFAHTFHPQRKSVALACEERFREEFHLCRINKFRNSSDLLCTSFLYPCYAYSEGLGVFSRLRAWYFNIRDLTAKSLYVELLGFKSKKNGPFSVCLNDHLNDNLTYNFEEYEYFLNEFLDTYFPDAYSFENTFV